VTIIIAWSRIWRVHDIAELAHEVKKLSFILGALALEIRNHLERVPSGLCDPDRSGQHLPGPCVLELKASPKWTSPNPASCSSAHLSWNFGLFAALWYSPILSCNLTECKASSSSVSSMCWVAGSHRSPLIVSRIADEVAAPFIMMSALSS